VPRGDYRELEGSRPIVQNIVQSTLTPFPDDLRYSRTMAATSCW